jgi:hypothetical protein
MNNNFDLREEIGTRLLYAVGYIESEGMERAINSLEDLINLTKKEATNIPMGVSKWKEIGIKNSYWEYFEKQVKKEVLEEALNAIPENVGTNDYTTGIEHAYEECKKIINNLMKKYEMYL